MTGADADDIRIIAKDCPHLAADQRAILNNAADEYEDLQRKLILLYAQLIETQHKLIAVNDHLLDMRRGSSRWTMGTGWLKAEPVR